MRWSLWLLALFGVAVATALGLSLQWGTVTVFIAPYRVDLSLNLVILGLLLGFVLCYLALRGVLGFMELPVQARRWRSQQREHAAQQGLLKKLKDGTSSNASLDVPARPAHARTFALFNTLR